MTTTEQTRTVLIDAILSGEREQANRLLDDYAASRNHRAAMNDLLEPVLEDIGNRWAEESISLAQGYIAGKVAEDMLLKIHDSEQYTADKQPDKGPVVVGNIEDDYHSLGRRLVSVFLQSAGWQVFDLGNDVTAAEFVDNSTLSHSVIVATCASTSIPVGLTRTKMRE